MFFIKFAVYWNSVPKLSPVVVTSCLSSCAAFSPGFVLKRATSRASPKIIFVEEPMKTSPFAPINSGAEDVEIVRSVVMERVHDVAFSPCVLTITHNSSSCLFSFSVSII